MGLYEQLLAQGYAPSEAMAIVQQVVLSSLPRSKSDSGFDMFRDNQYAANSLNDMTGNYDFALQSGTFDPMAFTPQMPTLYSGLSSNDPVMRGVAQSVQSGASLPQIISGLLDTNGDGTSDVDPTDPVRSAYISSAEQMMAEKSNPQLSGIASYARDQGYPDPREQYTFDTFPGRAYDDLQQQMAQLAQLQARADKYKRRAVRRDDIQAQIDRLVAEQNGPSFVEDKFAKGVKLIQHAKDNPIGTAVDVAGGVAGAVGKTGGVVGKIASVSSPIVAGAGAVKNFLFGKPDNSEQIALLEERLLPRSQRMAQQGQQRVGPPEDVRSNMFGGRNWLMDQTYQQRFADPLATLRQQTANSYFTQMMDAKRAADQGRTPFTDYLARRQQVALMGLVP